MHWLHAPGGRVCVPLCTLAMVLTLGCGGDELPPEDHAPTVDDASVSTPEDVPVAVTISTGDVDGDLVSIDVEAPSNGALTVSGLTVTYTPASNFFGTEALTVTATAGGLGSTAVLEIVVTPVNDPPDAVDDLRAAVGDQVQSIPVSLLLANDTDPDGDALTVISVTDPTGGTVALGSGTVEFTPDANVSGDVTFVYTITDGAETDTATVTLQFGAGNDAPIAVDDSRTTSEDTAAVITGASLVANDTDVDGDALIVTAVDSAINGAVSLVGDAITFTPTANVNGAASFQYTVSDGTLTDTGLVTVTVTAVNDAPVAVDDSRTTSEDNAAVITGASLVANDTDVDGDVLTVTAVGSASNGAVSLVGDAITFAPTANFNGAASFQYTVSDGTLTDTGLVTVTVAAVNDAPVAVDDSRTTNQDTALVITGASLVANDTDVDGDTLTVTAVGSAINGAVSLAGGTVTFTPTANFHGAASFQYTVSDGTLTDTGLVTVTVIAPGSILQLVGGNSHICALRFDGTVKCWGLNAYGNLGLGDTNSRGNEPNEMGTNLPLVQLGTGRTAVTLAAGGEHTCALLDNNTVKCWGYNSAGQLGLGDGASRGNGPGQMGDSLPALSFGTGRTVVQMDGGAEHTCAVLDNGSLKCWGGNANGQLGLGDTANRGDAPGEMGNALPAVNLGTGRTAIMVSAGGAHTCALLDNLTTKCWGSNFRGQLGLGDTADRGDAAGEMGDNLPVVNLGAGLTAGSLVLGELHSCALLSNSSVKCWGFGSFGALGIGDSSDRGGAPGEMGNALPAVNLGAGRTALGLAAGHHTCALLDNLAVKCWGYGDFGQLGQGNTSWIGTGPNQMGNNLPPVALGTGVVADAISAMLYDSCVLTSDDRVKCWGGNLNGQLGQGDNVYRGDGPGEMGDSLPFINLW